MKNEGIVEAYDADRDVEGATAGGGGRRVQLWIAGAIAGCRCGPKDAACEDRRTDAGE